MLEKERAEYSELCDFFVGISGDTEGGICYRLSASHEEVLVRCQQLLKDLFGVEFTTENAIVKNGLAVCEEFRKGYCDFKSAHQHWSECRVAGVIG